MAREHNVIQQQDRPQKPATSKISALQIHTACQRPAQQNPATIPTETCNLPNNNPATCQEEPCNQPSSNLRPAN